MKNILLRIAFVGTNYAGWQRQKNALSIQQLFEEALHAVTKSPHAITGCSRTDAGVHAEDYIANFLTESNIPPDRFAPALQSQLPRDILIKNSRSVRLDFNSRRHSFEKKYRYQIVTDRSPFYNDHWWQTAEMPDFAALQASGRLIVGVHDFSGFCVSRSLKVDNRCEIKQATWRRRGRKLYFTIVGDRFLHHMVRFLVGTQLETATGKRSLEEFRRILESPDRFRARFPAPAEGLYLEKVKYR